MSPWWGDSVFLPPGGQKLTDSFKILIISGWRSSVSQTSAPEVVMFVTSVPTRPSSCWMSRAMSSSATRPPCSTSCSGKHYVSKRKQQLRHLLHFICCSTGMKCQGKKDVYSKSTKWDEQLIVETKKAARESRGEVLIRPFSSEVSC